MIVAEDNDQAHLGSWHISFGAFTLGNLVLGNGQWESLELGCSLVVVDGQGQISLLIVEAEFLGHGELLAEFEEVWVCLHLVILAIFVEAVGDLDWGGVVVRHLELLDTEPRGQHGGVKSGSPGHTFE